MNFNKAVFAMLMVCGSVVMAGEAGQAKRGRGRPRKVVQVPTPAVQSSTKGFILVDSPVNNAQTVPHAVKSVESKALVPVADSLSTRVKNMFYSAAYSARNTIAKNQKTAGAAFLGGGMAASVGAVATALGFEKAPVVEKTVFQKAQVQAHAAIVSTKEAFNGVVAQVKAHPYISSATVATLVVASAAYAYSQYTDDVE